MGEVEAIFTLTSLNVNFVEKFSHKLDDFRQRSLVRVVLRRVFQTGFEEKRVSSKTSRGFGEVSVELELAGLRLAFRFLETGRESVSKSSKADQVLKHTSTNLANAGFAPFSFSNSYLPYN